MTDLEWALTAGAAFGFLVGMFYILATLLLL